MNVCLEPIAAEPARELAQLTQSGENWRIVLHGGPGGDILMEGKRTCRLALHKHHRQPEV
jgi:hypothetical protein